MSNKVKTAKAVKQDPKKIKLKKQIKDLELTIAAAKKIKDDKKVVKLMAKKDKLVAKLESNLPSQKFRGLKLINTELKSTIFMAVLIGVVMAALSLISVFVQKEYPTVGSSIDGTGSPVGDNEVTLTYIQGKTFGNVAQALSSVAIYSIINRIRLVIRDKSTLDRNRTMFLTNRKETVVFSKVIVDLFSFMIPVAMVLIIGLPLLSAKGGVFGDDFALKMTAFVFVLMFSYLISTFVMRWITALEVSKFKMWLILGTWITFTLLWMVGGGIAFGILGGIESGDATKVYYQGAVAGKPIAEPSLKDLIDTGKMPVAGFFYNNQIWIACIPILNFVTPFMELYGFMDMWTVAPLIGEALIALIILWRPVSGILKTYLTT